ncbi:MAG: rRNA maturation RNase YbeY [Lachnospiraceae bacterium]|nr:rRNA maturation RNase YbeY [bacterium]MDY5518257.1 rRNA maturation RNase YbeY [Lachnospiraceae bacterium]
MTILLEEETDVAFDFDYQTLAKDVITAACDAEKCPYEAEVNLTLVDNDSIHQINREHRQIDRPTDVLSFPMLSYETPADFSHVEDFVEDNFNPDTGELLLGDIILSVDKVKEQACSYGHSEKREFAFLILHSMLHLFGYDHETEQEREEMEARQRSILEDLGITR